MRRERFVISDRSWAIIEPLVPGTARDSGVPAKDTRLFLEGVLWKVRAGGPWRGLGVFERIFEAISGEPDFEYALIDGTIVGVHQKASGAKGGLTTKVLALTDALGNLVRFELLPGQRSESTGAPELIKGLWFDALLADKAFDAVISAKRNRKINIPHDEEACKWRHLIENYFSKIKEFRGVNARYDKTDTSDQATWCIAATITALR